MVKIGYYTNDMRNVVKDFTELKNFSKFEKKLPYDWESPTIKVPKFSNFEKVNYAEIDGIYYFINDKIEVLGGLVELSLSCDYLSNAWGDIKDKEFTVERQEFKRNNALIDNEIINQSNNNFICRTVGDSVNQNYNIYLTTCGGVD